MNQENFLYKEETFKIIGAMMEVHKTLGCGFLEAVYQEALAIEFQLRNIPFEREKKMTIYYKEFELGTHYKADFYCYDKIVVELKALSALIPTHEAITLHYLNATNSKVGLLANFGEPSLKYKRLVN